MAKSCKVMYRRGRKRKKKISFNPAEVDSNVVQK